MHSFSCLFHYLPFFYTINLTMKKKYYYLYLIVFAVLCSAVFCCQQDRKGPLSEEKTAPRPGSNARLTELLDAMQMYHFDVVQEAPSFELLSVT
ncbi:MAG: hypothetical protein AMK71_06165, partial [Nitrospira bacterium SG8_35_4]